MLEEGLKENIKKLGLDYTVNRAGSLVCLFFAKGPIENYDDVKALKTSYSIKLSFILFSQASIVFFLVS